MPINQQLDSPFFASLPAEVRNIIYECYPITQIYNVQKIEIRIGNRNKPLNDLVLASGQEAPLMRTCRLVATELRPIICQHALLRPGSMWEDGRARLCVSGPYDPSLIRFLHVHIHGVSERAYWLDPELLRPLLCSNDITGIQSILINLESDYMLSKTTPADRHFILIMLEEAIQDNMSMLRGLLDGSLPDFEAGHLRWKALRSVQLIGIFHQGWLDELEHSLLPVGLKTLRGRPYHDEPEGDEEEHDLHDTRRLYDDDDDDDYDEIAHSRDDFEEFEYVRDYIEVEHEPGNEIGDEEEHEGDETHVLTEMKVILEVCP